MTADERAWFGLLLVDLDISPGVPITGLWCETCLLPSRYDIPLYTFGVDAVTRVGTVGRCDGCSEVVR